mmetsp:Transcript_66650/g.214742  ORF Transcript_66650/g.214742 Transcript_66650/m.214742 type:complete len:232 (-) Transcript_66650:114-809(-)
MPVPASLPRSARGRVAPHRPLSCEAPEAQAEQGRSTEGRASHGLPRKAQKGRGTQESLAEVGARCLQLGASPTSRLSSARRSSAESRVRRHAARCRASLGLQSAPCSTRSCWASVARRSEGRPPHPGPSRRSSGRSGPPPARPRAAQRAARSRQEAVSMAGIHAPPRTRVHSKAARRPSMISSRVWPCRGRRPTPAGLLQQRSRLRQTRSAPLHLGQPASLCLQVRQHARS